jgi:hypothetical protein
MGFTMARPRKDKLEARTAHLPPIRLTEAELAMIAELVRASGLSLSEYVRQRLLSGKVTPRPPLSDAALLAELNRCGVNLNQIARALNAGAGLPTSVDKTLLVFHDVLDRVGSAYGS